MKLRCKCGGGYGNCPPGPYDFGQDGAFSKLLNLLLPLFGRGNTFSVLLFNTIWVLKLLLFAEPPIKTF